MKRVFTVLIGLTIFASFGERIRKENNIAQDETKNVLFIIADDLTKVLGCYDHPMVKTPNIDRIASMGILFDNAYSNYAVCNPSRSSFLTGLLPETTTILDNRKGLQSVIGDWVTLPALFKKNGFHTMSLGKIFHTGEEKHNDFKAWDEIYDYGPTALGKTGEHRNMTNGALKWCWWQAAEGTDEDQGDGQTAKKAVEFINSEHEKPFFLAVGLKKPHDPFIAPKKYFDMYPLEDCEISPIPEGWEPPYKHTLPGETKEFDQFTDRERKEFLRSYYACTSFMDAQVGKIIDALEESGQLNSTLIVFMGDHGYHLGEHNWWNKVTLFEQGTSTPFIMAGPSIEHAGARSQAMIEFVDLYPMFADYFGLENAPDNLEGESFVSILNKPSDSFRTEVRSIINRGKMLGRTVKNTDWRYVEWADGDMGRELYDQVNDPQEYHNQADNPEFKLIVEEMSQLIIRNKKR